MKLTRLLVPPLLAAMSVSPALTDEASDAYLAGYASALLEERFGLEGVGFEVQGGVLRIDPDDLPAARREAILESLRGIEGLSVVAEGAAEAAREPAKTAPPEDRDATEKPGDLGLLPEDLLFSELVADPRWPRFAATAQFYQDDPELDTVGSADFGATLPLYGWRALGGEWQIGVQGAVFSIFDLEAESFDLINSDFLAGIPLSARFGRFTGQFRLIHQSSHLGDEFVLRNRAERINLSFEAADFLLSVNPIKALRLYGGGSVLIRRDPADLDRFGVQGGVEFLSPEPLVDHLYPLAAFDVQSREETDWEGDYSVTTGLELRPDILANRRLQFLVEYYNGRSPNGQFYERRIEYFGTGLAFYF